MLSFFFGSWRIELVLEQSNPFPIETKECINITPAQQLKMPASPLIISALDSSKERRVMD